MNNQPPKVVDQKTEVIPNLLNDNKKHIQIIGMFAKVKKINFTSKAHQFSFINRNLRAASNLKCYDLERIDEVLVWLRENADFKYTLETVGKYIDEDLDNLKQFNNKPKNQVLDVDEVVRQQNL
jgi:hypothetical protein